MNLLNGFFTNPQPPNTDMSLQIGYGKQLSRTLFEEKLVAQYHPLMNAKVAHVISAVKSLGFGPEIIEKCEKWLEADPMDICRLTAPSGSFATIAHGDCWMNNILYKYNENGQVEDLLFVSIERSTWLLCVNVFQL